MLQTSFPDLPFTNHAEIELSPHGTHASVNSSAPRYHPSTDLETLTSWTSFPTDVHQAIQSAVDHAGLPPDPFTVPTLVGTNFVKNEGKLCAYAHIALHDPVQNVLGMLGVNGEFDWPGGGVAQVIGAPHMAWVEGITQMHPKLIVEYTTWWDADLLHVIDAFNGTRTDPVSLQTLHALEQTYGYMVFNNNRYGILTNWKRALFLRRAETSDRKTLEYYSVELNVPGEPIISMLKAWVGIALLAKDDWFYASHTVSPPPPTRHFGSFLAAFYNQITGMKHADKYHMPINFFNGEYKCCFLDYRLCRFDLSSIRRGVSGCVVNGRFLSSGSFIWQHDQAVCKVVDISQSQHDHADLLADEVRAYAALKDLQGEVIPRLYGYFEVWGILRVLAMQPVGEAISEDELISLELRAKMKAGLQRIHDAGFVHGDIARRNFCKMGNDVFLVDLERCRRFGDSTELDNEMKALDRL